MEEVQVESLNVEETKAMNIYEKLGLIQFELKAPKGQYNKFGNYSYRSCEDILESLKPLLQKYRLCINMNDNLELLQNRFYIKASVVLINIDNPTEIITNYALAREEETKKGMDGSQITGASSSYARKYALNGMFAIDDTKDSDTTNTHDKTSNTTNTKDNLLKNYSKEKVFKYLDKITEEERKKIFDYYKVEFSSHLDEKQLQDLYLKLNKKGVL